MTDASGAPEACAPECEAGLIESRPGPRPRGDGGVWGEFQACVAELEGEDFSVDERECVVDVPNTPVELAIDTRGRQNNFETRCAEATGGDTPVTVRIAAAGRDHFTVTQADFDTVLSLRAVCEEAEVACYDNTTLLRSGLDVDLEIGEYALPVDGVRGAVGTATVRIERAPPWRAASPRATSSTPTRRP